MYMYVATSAYMYFSKLLKTIVFRESYIIFNVDSQYDIQAGRAQAKKTTHQTHQGSVNILAWRAGD